MKKEIKRRALFLFLLVFSLQILLFFDIPKKFMEGKRERMENEWSFLKIEKTQGKEEVEWRVPNVTDLPLKMAIEKLLPYTERIRVFGTGYVVRQYPKAFEVIKGEAECVLYAEIKR